MSRSALLRLEGLSLLQLRYLSYTLGLPTAGSKKVLIKNIHGPLRSDPLSPTKDGLRVLSVDMGIRNLAYCVMDVANPSNPAQRAIAVTSWKRKDLTQENLRDSKDPLVSVPISDQSLGSPNILSKIAFATTQELLSHKPDIILIEQQRWRSSGAAGVQQWTIRVNSFENMIWACWRALQQTRPEPSAPFPEAYQVEPKRVATFFPQAKAYDLLLDPGMLLQDAVSSKDKLEQLFRKAGAKVTKAQKMAVVRGWLEENPDIALNFEGQAQEVAHSFQTRTKRTKSNATTKAEPFGKLDDLADCLLQGVTWYRWQQNTQRLAERFNIKSEGRDSGE